MRCPSQLMLTTALLLPAVATASMFYLYNEPKNLGAATAFCEAHGASLATLDDELQSAELDDMAHDRQIGSYWIAGSASGFENWRDEEEQAKARRQQGGGDAVRRCVMVTSTEWAHQNCSKRAPFACRTDNDDAGRAREVLRKWSQRKSSERIATPLVAAPERARRTHDQLAIDCAGYLWELPTRVEGEANPCSTMAPTAPPTPWRPCDDRPCANGGTCVELGERRGRQSENDGSGDDGSGGGDDDGSGDDSTGPQFQCVCHGGWQGPTCEVMSAAPTVPPTVPPTVVPTVAPTVPPTVPPTVAPTVTSCHDAFEQAKTDFPAMVMFQPGTSADDVLIGASALDADGPNTVVASNNGATRLQVTIAFASDHWGPNEPKIAVKLVHPDTGRSVIQSGTVNITEDSYCDNGDFIIRTGHPSTTVLEQRTLRYGLGTAKLEATVGSWAPKVPGYTLKIFLLRDRWDAQTPPQAEVELTGIDLTFNETYIHFEHDNQRMVPYSSTDMYLTLDVSWRWPALGAGRSVDIIAMVPSTMCPHNNCVESWPVLTSTGGQARALASEGSTELRINLKRYTPLNPPGGDPHAIVLYLQDSNPACEQTNDCVPNKFRAARLAQSNALSFRVYAPGAAEGNFAAEGGDDGPVAVGGSVAAGSAVIGVASIVLITVVGIGGGLYRRHIAGAARLRADSVSPVSPDSGDEGEYLAVAGVIIDAAAELEGRAEPVVTFGAEVRDFAATDV